jgi:hypothetical protein
MATAPGCGGDRGVSTRHRSDEGIRRPVLSLSAAAGMTAAAAQFRHVFGFFTVFGAVLSELTIWRDGARTTGVSALLRLIHTASCSQGLTDVLSHEDGHGGPVRLWVESRNGRVRPGLGNSARERPFHAWFAGCCTSLYVRRLASRTLRRFGPAGAAGYFWKTAS